MLRRTASDRLAARGARCCPPVPGGMLGRMAGRTSRAPAPRLSLRGLAAFVAVTTAVGVGALVGRLLYLDWQGNRVASLCEGPVSSGSAGYGPCATYHGGSTPGLVAGAVLGLLAALAVSRVVAAFRHPLV